MLLPVYQGMIVFLNKKDCSKDIVFSNKNFFV